MTNPIYKGIILGACTVECAMVRVAIEIARGRPHHVLEGVMSTTISLSFLFMPAGLAFGTLLGWLAGKLRTRRVLVLETIGLVAIFASPIAIMEALVLVNSISDPRPMDPLLIAQFAISIAFRVLPLVLPPVALGIFLLERWVRPTCR